MDFRTKVELPEKETEIRHSDQIMLFGSCFAENIGNLLSANKFSCDVNPFGVLYNPLSVAEAIGQIREGKTYRRSDLICIDGRWHSLMHHSDFSADTAEDCLRLINERFARATQKWASLDWLLITWGSAWVYEWRETGQVVGNCHKLPDRLFRRRLLEVDEIVGAYTTLLYNIRATHPELKVLLTVSPIRHARDGMHANQVSKATLLLAVEKLQKECPNCYYFPSYEIMMDELRDYRFYADDMMHPSAVAVDYLWDCFSRCYFSDDTRQVMREWEAVRKALQHRPSQPQSEAYRNFLTEITLRIQRLKEKLPYLDVQKELEQCRERLKI